MIPPRYWLAPLLVLISGMAALATPAGAQEDLPRAEGHVNDFAGVIPAEMRADLETRLRAFEEETAVEIVVVTVPNLGGDSIEGYAVRLFEAWGIGKKGVDNGILLLLSRDERRVKIEVGYGMEPYLTDGQAGRILDSEMVPSLRANDYGQGLLKGATAVAQAIRDNGYEPGTVRPRGEGGRLPVSPVVIFGVLGGLAYVAAYMARTREIVLGGLLGAAGGGIAGFVLGGLLAAIIGVIAAGLLGLLLDAILSSAYRYQVRTGGPTSWGSSWGGFRGSGHWGGGSGGFGGFGGGRSGGGGASRGF